MAHDFVNHAVVISEEPPLNWFRRGQEWHFGDQACLGQVAKMTTQADLAL